MTLIPRWPGCFRAKLMNPPISSSNRASAPGLTLRRTTAVRVVLDGDALLMPSVVFMIHLRFEFEPAFLLEHAPRFNSQLLHACNQSGSLQTHSCSSAVGAANTAVGVSQDTQDVALLLEICRRLEACRAEQFRVAGIIDGRPRHGILLCKGAMNQTSQHAYHSVLILRSRLGQRRGSCRLRRVRDLKAGTARHNHGSFNDVLQFTNVSRPLPLRQPAHRRPRNALNLLPHAPRVL